MYLRTAHAEHDIPLLQQFIHDNPLGILTTAIKSSDHAFIQSSHIPFLLDLPEVPIPISSEPNEGKPLGILRGHVAKQNPQAKALIEALSQTTNTNSELPDEVLILFNGAHHHYVTPKFYTETKPSTGKVVPTWNYSAVQVYGKIKVYADSKSEDTAAFLSKQVDDLSRHAETSMGFTGGERPAAWNVGEAPVSYVEMLKKNIIGIEIRIERLQGKFKMSQEMGVGDREGVIQGFEALGSDVGEGIARLVKERGEMKDRKAA